MAITECRIGFAGSRGLHGVLKCSKLLMTVVINYMHVPKPCRVFPQLILVNFILENQIFNKERKHECLKAKETAVTPIG